MWNVRAKNFCFRNGCGCCARDSVRYFKRAVSYHQTLSRKLKNTNCKLFELWNMSHPWFLVCQQEIKMPFTIRFNPRWISTIHTSVQVSWISFVFFFCLKSLLWGFVGFWNNCFCIRSAKNCVTYGLRRNRSRRVRATDC